MKKSSWLLLSIALISYSSQNSYATSDVHIYIAQRGASQLTPPEKSFRRNSSLSSMPSRPGATPSNEGVSPNTPTIPQKRTSLVTFIGSFVDVLFKSPQSKPEALFEPPIIPSIDTAQKAHYFVYNALDKELFKKMALFKILNKKHSICAFAFELPSPIDRRQDTFLYMNEYPYTADFPSRQELIWTYPTDILVKSLLNKDEYKNYLRITKELEVLDNEDCMIMMLKTQEDIKLYYYLDKDIRTTAILHGFIIALIRAINLYEKYTKIKNSNSSAFYDKEFITLFEKKGLVSLFTEKLETYQTIVKLYSQYLRFR